MLLTLYSSFMHFEEVINLTLSDVELEEAGFVFTFKKGKSYQFGESNIGIVANLPKLQFNPSRVFSIYLDTSLHARSKKNSDWLFPSCRVSKMLEISLDKLVSYSVIKKQFSLLVYEFNMVKKAIRVKSRSNVGYYAPLTYSF